MRFSICSYSFHRTAAAGDMDIFKYIDWNKEHGFSQLDPWMKHMELGYEDDAYIAKVKAAGDAAGLPFGCVAVDGGHIYEPTAEKRAANRKVAKRWIDICQQLDAEQVRIDAGGREETLDQIFDIVVEGYNELVAYARARGVELKGLHVGKSSIRSTLLPCIFLSTFGPVIGIKEQSQAVHRI